MGRVWRLALGKESDWSPTPTPPAGDGEWGLKMVGLLCQLRISQELYSADFIFVFRVLCLNCGEQTARRELQNRFQALNPSWSAEAQGVAPDGDVFLTEEQVRSFRVPCCDRCGGPLKPDVVFFGDTVNPDKVDFVHQRVKEADSLLVVGSSLQVPDSVRVAFALAHLTG